MAAGGAHLIVGSEVWPKASDPFKTQEISHLEALVDILHKKLYLVSNHV